jgi:hypothetical protein
MKRWGGCSLCSTTPTRFRTWRSDRFYLRWAFALAVLLWSAVSVLTGLANGFVALLIFRLSLGVVESANWPAGMRVMARLLDPRERALGNGIFTSGTRVGALIAPRLILGIAAIWGWRWAFVLIGSLSVFWICGWLLMTRDPEMTPVWREPVAPGTAGLAGQWRIFSGICEKPAISACAGCRDAGQSVPLLQRQLAAHMFCPATRSEPWPADGLDSHGDLSRPRYRQCRVRQFHSGADSPWKRRSKGPQNRFHPNDGGGGVLCGRSDSADGGSSHRAGAGELRPGHLGCGVSAMAQEVSGTHVSTAIGILSGCGSLAGALAMWAVGRVTRQTASFAIPMSSVALATVLAAMAMGGQQRIQEGGDDLSFLPDDLSVDQIRTMMRANPERLLAQSKPICPKS